MEIAVEPASDKKWRRKGWLASLLSMCLPGLGQMYNGQLRKGLGFYLSATILSMSLLAAADGSHSLFLLASMLLIAGAIQLASAIEAGRTARRIGDHFRPASRFKSSRSAARSRQATS